MCIASQNPKLKLSLKTLKHRARLPSNYRITTRGKLEFDIQTTCLHLQSMLHLWEETLQDRSRVHHSWTPKVCKTMESSKCSPKGKYSTCCWGPSFHYLKYSFKKRRRSCICVTTPGQLRVMVPRTSASFCMSVTLMLKQPNSPNMVFEPNTL